MKNRHQRNSEAKERQAEYDKLTTVQKLTLLDLKFGAGLGAKAQRQRLNLKLIKEKNSEGEVVPGAGNQRPQKKIYQKPKKS